MLIKETASSLVANDSLGSPTHTVAAQNHIYVRYTPFGFSSHPACAVVGFAGQFREALTEQYLLGNGYRGYMPGLMRFGTPDSDSPFDRGGINAYVYCEGDPVNRVDPTGHMGWKGLTSLFAGTDETVAALASRTVSRASSTVRQRPAPAHIPTRPFPAVQEGGPRSGPSLPPRQIRGKVNISQTASNLSGGKLKPPLIPKGDPEMYVQEWLERSQSLLKPRYLKNRNTRAIGVDNHRARMFMTYLDPEKHSGFAKHWLTFD